LANVVRTYYKGALTFSILIYHKLCHLLYFRVKWMVKSENSLEMLDLMV